MADTPSDTYELRYVNIATGEKKGERPLTGTVLSTLGAHGVQAEYHARAL